MRLTSADYKEIARGALRGKWVRAIGTTILAVLLGAFFSSIPFLACFMGAMGGFVRFFEGLPHSFIVLMAAAILLAVFWFFAGGAVRYGLIDFNLALLDRRKARPGMLTGHFSSFWKAVYMRIAVFFYLLIFTALLVVPGIIAYYAYAMVPYILEEKPDYSVGKALRMSRSIMRGHKWQLFCLRFSFIGWYLLGIVTFGVAFLFVIPYLNAAEAAFYNEISGRADVYYGRNSRRRTGTIEDKEKRRKAGTRRKGEKD